MRRPSDQTSEERQLEGKLLRGRFEQADHDDAPMLAMLMEEEREPTLTERIWRRVRSFLPW